MAPRLTTKLAVILHADVANSTALVHKNESLTHQRIQSAFQTLSRTTKTFGGTPHEIRGDALVALFSRASDAVCAALSFQLDNAQHQGSDNLEIECRIGISLGEVIIDSDTVTGAGVVLAQRLEQLAEPGTVVVQGSVSETVPARMPFEYASLGEQQIKGFEQPVRAFVVALKPDSDIPVPDSFDNHENDDREIVTADAENAGAMLSKYPSIAILPFKNLSSDPEQEYFGDGIADDIITAISKVSSLIVVARSSTFTYKGKSIDLTDVGREQGVDYVLEGSVRKAGNRIRVSAQLIETETGHHVWAERFDRELDDIFSVQDELMREIVVALDVKLRTGEQARLWSRGTRNVEAWECVRLASAIILGDHDGNFEQARKMLERALELDSTYAIAWVMFGWYYQNYADIGGALRSEEERKAALSLMQNCARKAIELDPFCADAYSVMAMYHMERSEFEEAAENAEKSISLAPNNAENLVEATGVMVKSGNPHRGLEFVKRAIRLCPVYRAGFLRAYARALRFTGNPQAAVDSLRMSLDRQPDFLSAHVNLASILGELERIEEAEAEAQEVLRLAPDFSITKYMSGLSYQNPQDLQRVKHGLTIAGLPD
jgi:adenylate cyclase